ncbi:MAG: NAD(P)-dependent alcohol dehydrogenase [Acidithiobacillales bacterium]
MKAIVQVSYGSPDGLELREIEKPAIADDRVLVRVRAASVNAADWHLMKRLPHLISRFFGMRPSRVRGGDLAGVVEVAGKNVTRLTPGDEVFGSGMGTFAEFATAPEDRLAPKPRNLTFEQAAAMSGAGCTALQGLRDKGEVKPGQQVLIYGAGGGVGTFAVQIARALGARVTAVTSTANLELVRSIGADEAIDYTKEDFTRRGERWDVVFDIGADRSFADLRRVLSPDGKVVLCGAPSSIWLALASLIKAQLMSRAGSRQISYVTRIRQSDLLALNDLAEAGKLVPVIDRQYPLAEVPEALRYLGTKQARGKVVISVA